MQIHGVAGWGQETRWALSVLIKAQLSLQTGTVRVWDLADLSAEPIFEEKLHDGKSHT